MANKTTPVSLRIPEDILTAFEKLYPDSPRRGMIEVLQSAVMSPDFHKARISELMGQVEEHKILMKAAPLYDEFTFDEEMDKWMQLMYDSAIKQKNPLIFTHENLPFYNERWKVSLKLKAYQKIAKRWCKEKNLPYPPK